MLLPTDIAAGRFYAPWGALVVAVVAILVLTLWLRQPWRLLNGWLFMLLLGLILIESATLVIAFGRTWLFYTAIVLLILALVVLVVLTTFSWLLFLWNAWLVWKRESHNLANMLTLFVGVGLIALWLINVFNAHLHLPTEVQILLSFLPLAIGYLVLVLVNFLVNVALYQIYPHHYDQDYLIVLGAGLIEGHKVSRLLGSRIDRAFKFARKQEAQGKRPPKIIFSGGQGPDEEISEAEAMARYAADRGWPEALTLKETRSRNTEENMTLSQHLAQEDAHHTEIKALFVSNNYHIFRAGMLAHQVGFPITGIGSATRLYFLPNALLREYAAIFVMHKRRHMIVLGGLALVILGLAALQFFIR